MFFSEKFNVSKQLLKDYGAIDISLVCDIPLFIDPMLIFNSDKQEYRTLHEQIIQYFSFLYEKSKSGASKGDISAYFTFSEIKNNWLGYSQEGNEGNGLGGNFAKFLATNLSFIFNDNDISQSKHIEKALLVYEGSGKDKISDLAVFLILGYLAEYTERFAKENIKEVLLGQFYIKYKFDYDTETFVEKQFNLPYIINRKSQKEFILLTPHDILRRDEPAISKQNLKEAYDDVRKCIDNDILQVQLTNYIGKRVAEYIQAKAKSKKKPSENDITSVEKKAFKDAFKEMPWLYDYFIKYIEQTGNFIASLSDEEVNSQIEKFYENSRNFALAYKAQFPETKGVPNSRAELINRLNYFKDCIENQDCYKCFYTKDGKRFSTENDLQRFFRFVWRDTEFDVNFEANNGRGNLDAKVSFGAKDKTIAEFKLASNPNLFDIVEQAKIYEQANHTTYPSVYVVFVFSETDMAKANKLIGNYSNATIINSIIIIDCRKDNKISASRART